MGPVPPLPAEFFTGLVKVNGVTSSGNVVVGHFTAILPLVVDKSNEIVSVHGDRTVAPVTWALISDPDLIDAPIYHQGFL